MTGNLFFIYFAQLPGQAIYTEPRYEAMQSDMADEGSGGYYTDDEDYVDGSGDGSGDSKST